VFSSGLFERQVLRGIRAIISSSHRICQRYGVGMATDESTVQGVAMICSISLGSLC
jgi:hypothetical protein